MGPLYHFGSVPTYSCRLGQHSCRSLSIDYVIATTSMTSVGSDQPIDHKTLLIGASVLRYVDEQKLKNTEVRCLYGAQVRHIALELDALANGEARYARIVIIADGTDEDSPVEHIDLDVSVSWLRLAITAAKRMSDDVAVSEIPPRVSPWPAIVNRSKLNKKYCALTKRLSVPFLRNRSQFMLPSNEINHNYYHDDVQLTFKGTQKLIESMGLISYRYIGSCSLQPTQTLPLTRPSPMPSRGYRKPQHSLSSSLEGSQHQMGPPSAYVTDTKIPDTKMVPREDETCYPKCYIRSFESSNLRRSLSNYSLGGTQKQMASPPTNTTDMKSPETKGIPQDEETCYPKCCCLGSLDNLSLWQHGIQLTGIWFSQTICGIALRAPWNQIMIPSGSIGLISLEPYIIRNERHEMRDYFLLCG